MKVLTKDGKPILVEGKMLCVDEVTQISDITVNGDSIVVDGVAEIPLASDVQPGIVKTNLSAGVQISNDALLGMTKTSQQYSQGSNGLFISKGTLENILPQKVKDNSLFVYVEYGATASVSNVEEIDRILESNKIPYVYANSRYQLYSGSSAGYHYFGMVYAVGNSSTAHFTNINRTTGAWGSASYRALEQRENKTDDISANATDSAKYPSTKAVYDYAEPKKGDWVLKGTLTTDNKDTGVNVDLTGCSELMIKSYINATGDINSTLVGTSLGNCVYGMGRNGNAYYVGIWKDVEGLGVLNTTSVFGIYGFGQLTPSTGVVAYTYCHPYAKISNATALTLNNQSNITECNIEIWAR